VSNIAASRPPAWTAALRLLAAATMLPYVHLAYRIRGWGRLPRRRGPTLVIANHQHDLDSMAIMARLTLDRPWTGPIRTVSSRRMFEPGFFAVRTPWLAPLVRGYDPSALFEALGSMPIENDLRSRILDSVLRGVRRRHGNIRLAEVVPATVLEARGLSTDVRLDDLAAARWFDAARAPLELRDLREPHRTEVRGETRRLVDEDLARIEATLRAGGTFFLTPEGHYTTSGRILRFRDAFARLVPLADVWLAAISYDVLRGARLSQLYRIVRPERSNDVLSSLKAARPVTVSQLLAPWLLTRGSDPFSEATGVAAVGAALAVLPERLFVDPEVRRDPQRVVREAVATCERLGILTKNGSGYRLTECRRHPRFGEVADVVAFQANSFAETLEGSAALDAG